MRLWIEAGLLNFGDFAHYSGRAPFQARFELLSSYPDVLAVCAQALVPLVESKRPSRLLCAADSLPLGVALSLEMGIPLIYSRARGELAVDDLVGAYDIGHLTLLIANVVDGDLLAQPWIARSRHVGLEVLNAVGLLSTINTLPPSTQCLVSLGDAAGSLDDWGMLPPGQAREILRWLARDR